MWAPFQWESKLFCHVYKILHSCSCNCCSVMNRLNYTRKDRRCRSIQRDGKLVNLLYVIIIYLLLFTTTSTLTVVDILINTVVYMLRIVQTYLQKIFCLLFASCICLQYTINHCKLMRIKKRSLLQFMQHFSIVFTNLWYTVAHNRRNSAGAWLHAVIIIFIN